MTLPLLDIVQTETKGRCFLANKPISKGEIVLECLPFGSIVDTGSRSSVCAFCLSPLPSNPVQCCPLFYYCDLKCQSKDALIHSKECAYLQQCPLDGSDYEIDFFRLILRILILMLEKREENQPVWDLCSNANAFPMERQERISILSRQLELALTFIYQESSACLSSKLSAIHSQDLPSSLVGVSDTLFAKIYALICKEECNSFGLYTFTNQGPTVPRQSFGLALYPTAVYFNHSCIPNVGHVSRGNRLVFYALKDIAKGEEACVSYLELHQAHNFDHRQETLQNYFFFQCACDLCTEKVTFEASLKRLEYLKCQKTTHCKGWKVPSAIPNDHGLLMNTWYCEACLESYS